MIDHASALFALFPRLKRFEIFILSVAGPEQLFQKWGAQNYETSNITMVGAVE